MSDLLLEHSLAQALFEVGRKSAADLHFSGKLQIDGLGDLVVDVPSALLRGCFAAVKEPGVELSVSPTWRARFVVIRKEDLQSIGGARVISERGKDFDFRVLGSNSAPANTPGLSRVWYLEIDCPAVEQLRQAYGLSGKPEHGFRAVFGIRRARLFTDNQTIKKLVPAEKKEVAPGSTSGEWKWVKVSRVLESVQLQPHQKALADEIDEENPARKMLLWSTGSGKSLGALAAAEAFGRPYTAIGPAAMRTTMRKEQDRFTDKSLPSSILSYQKALNSEIEHPDSLIIDEAQRIANPESRQSRVVQDVARRAKQVLLLSGTPLVNRPGDLAPALSILTGKRISPQEFESRYLGQKAEPRSWSSWLAGKPIQYSPIIQNRDELKSLLEGKVDWYKPETPMVDTKYSDHEVEMSPEQSRLYSAMFGKIPLRLRLGMDGQTNLTPKELTRLRSFLAGPRQVGLSDYPFASHGDPLKSFQTSAKLQKAFELLKQRLDSDARQKAIVYSNFPRAGLEPYRAALLHHKIPHIMFDGSLSDAQRAEALREFNEGKARVALVGPAGAEGISLRGAQLLQQLDPHWQQARMDQAKARGIRFDSHSHLPVDLRNMEIQRFISKLPARSRNILQLLGATPPAPRPASDDYLRQLSQRKDEVNQLFMDLLKEVGQRKTSAELEAVWKTAQMVSVHVGQVCDDCHANLGVEVSRLDPDTDVICKNCGRKGFLLLGDEDKSRVIAEAERITRTDPSKPQMEAGNYRKGQFGWEDLVITIESPKGSVRSGVTKDGKKWETEMQDSYGYILRHVSEADGDPMDVFIANDPDFITRLVFVVDQFIDGKFDEHKCVLFARDADHAKEIYHRNYQKGWDGFKNVSSMSVTEFKKWLVEGDTSKPVFAATPESVINRVKKALKDSAREVKVVDKTGDDSGGYGHVYICERKKKAWLIVGDWWSKEVMDIYKKHLRDALSGYELEVEAEGTPSSYSSRHGGDWVVVK